jgi:hypothetical protein
MSQVKIIYAKSQDYRKYAAVGAFSGIVVNDMVTIEFYVESQEMPQELLVKLTPNGGVEKEEDATGEMRTTRELQMGLVVPAHIAKRIGEFMISKANEVLEPKK